METVLPAIYRSNDPIDNLLVRISLRRRIPPANNTQSSSFLSSRTSSAENASLLSGVTEETKSHNSANFALNSVTSPRSPNNDSILETTASFAWQQKVYSPKELLRFAAIIEHKRSHDQNKSSPVKMLNETIHNMVNSAKGHASLVPQNAVEESYVKDIEARLENGEPVFESSSPVMLFSYVDADGAIPPDARSLESGREHLGAFSGLSSAIDGKNSSLTNAVLDPIHTHSRATSGSFKEHPFSTMYIMAALSVDTDAFRTRKLDCKMTEVCLAVVRVYKGSSSLLIETRPGFAYPVPYDRASLIALSRSVSGDSSSILSGSLAAQKLIEADTRLGTGQFGGSLRLNGLPTLPHLVTTEVKLLSTHALRSLNATTSLSYSEATSLPSLISIERSTDICAYAIEMHRFSLPDGSQYEYSVTNADEDIGRALKAAAVSAGSSLSPYLQKLVDAGVFYPDGDRSISLDPPSDDTEDLGESTLAAMQEADQESIELHSHRLGSEFFSRVPRSLLSKNIRSFKLSYYLEIVSVAKFYESDAVYVTYELQLPKGSGWRILPLTDIPEHHHTIAEKKKESGNQGEVVFRGKGFSDDMGVLDQDNHDSHWDQDVLLKDREEEHREAITVRGESETDENSPMLTASTLIDPDKRALAKKRQSLRSTPIQGVTQVACFESRPWTFGTPSASIPSGQRPYGSEGNAGSADVFFGLQSSALASNADVKGNSQKIANENPFDFDATGTTLGAGYARSFVSHDKPHLSVKLQKLSTGGVTNHSSTRSLSGHGSSSLLSGVSSDSSFGSAGAIASTSSAPPGTSSFERVSIPQNEIIPVAHIGYPLEFHLVCDLSSVRGGPGEISGTGGMPSSPVLFISVMSRDSWDRHRPCGYSYIDLPITAGVRDIVTSCWKPRGSSIQAESDFYLGGSTRLTGISYARVPSENSNSAGKDISSLGIANAMSGNESSTSHPVNHLSRFGFETETTGEIGLRCCSIIQRGSQPIRMINQSAQLSQVAGRNKGHQTMTGSSGVSSDEVNNSGNSKGSSGAVKSVDDVIAEARALRRRDRGKVQVNAQNTPIRSSKE